MSTKEKILDAALTLFAWNLLFQNCEKGEINKSKFGSGVVQ